MIHYKLRFLDFFKGKFIVLVGTKMLNKTKFDFQILNTKDEERENHLRHRKINVND